jgi:hypothetical protein
MGSVAEHHPEARWNWVDTRSRTTRGHGKGWQIGVGSRFGATRAPEEEQISERISVVKVDAVGVGRCARGRVRSFT